LGHFLQLLLVGICIVLTLETLSAFTHPVIAQTPSSQGVIVAQADLLEQVTQGDDEEAQEEPPQATQFPNGNQVFLGGQPLFTIETAAGALSREERAHEISQNVQQFARDRSLPIESLQVKQFPDELSLEIRGETIPLMNVYEADADALGEDQKKLADLYLQRISQGVVEYREVYSPRSMAIAAGKAAIAGLILWMLVWLINKIYRLALSWFTEIGHHLPTIRVGSQEIVHANQIELAVRWAARLLRIFLFFILGSIFLRTVLSFFPQTRNASRQLFRPVTASISQIFQDFVAYLPKLVFLIILAVITFYILKLIRLVFDEISKGVFSVPGFDQEWAVPTARIAQILTLALAAVISFPYLPGSGSGAFQGVSLFLGLLISLGSSSAISNIIAGILLTYARAFKIGDEVEIGGVSGTVVEKGVLVTRLLTFTNIFVSIPNSEILSSHVTNFRKGGTKPSENYAPPIVLMEFGFGYDVPWQEVHAILLEAANTCEWVLAEPPAFVLHRELSNYYCTYALRMYTNTPEKGILIQSWVMQQVQDLCIAKGIALELPEYACAVEQKS
jgi:small-conductance mechanosensitive channel